MTEEHKERIAQGKVRAWHRKKLEKAIEWASHAADEDLRIGLRHVNENIRDGYESAEGSEVTNAELKKIMDMELAGRVRQGRNP